MEKNSIIVDIPKIDKKKKVIVELNGLAQREISQFIDMANSIEDLSIIKKIADVTLLTSAIR